MTHVKRIANDLWPGWGDGLWIELRNEILSLYSEWPERSEDPYHPVRPYGGKPSPRRAYQTLQTWDQTTEYGRVHLRLLRWMIGECAKRLEVKKLKYGAVFELVETIRTESAKCGLTLYRYDINKGPHYNFIMYATHSGDGRPADPKDCNGPSVTITQLEWSSENCEVYQQLAKLLKDVRALF